MIFFLQKFRDCWTLQRSKSCNVLLTFSRVAKLMGLLRSTSSVNKHSLFPSLQNMTLHFYSVSSVATQTDWTQMERPARPHHLNQGTGESADHDSLEKRVIQISSRTVSPGKLLLPEEGPEQPDETLMHAHMNRDHPNPTCSPKSHIVFLKTHKTASSSILNILYRYGESRNLTFALPLKKHSQLFYPHFFSPRFVEGVSSGRVRGFHIMCNHMRFRKSEVSFVRKSVNVCVFYCLHEFPAEIIGFYYNWLIQTGQHKHVHDERSGQVRWAAACLGSV